MTPDKPLHAWAALAAKEGHRPRLPKSMSDDKRIPPSRVDMVKLSALAAGGASAQEIANRMDISRTWARRLRERALRELREEGVV